MQKFAMLCCLLATVLSCGTTFAQSVNDNCVDRLTLTSGVAEAFDTTLDSNDGPTPTCGGGTAPIDIWYEYTADCDGIATISACGSGFDTRLAVYSDLACPVATQVACNDDSCGLQSELTVPVLTGDVIIIQVCGFNAATGTGTVTASCGPGPISGVTCTVDDATTGDTTISWTNNGIYTNIDLFIDGVFFTSLSGGDTTTSLVLPVSASSEICVDGDLSGQACCTADVFPPLTNDDCATPSVIMDGVTPFGNIGATTDGLGVDPATCAQWAGDPELYNDIWYLYTASADGIVRVSTCNTVSFDSKLAVWDAATATCPIDPAVDTALACNDDGTGCAGFSSELTFNAVAGDEYLIQVGGFAAATTGSGDITIGPFVPEVTNLVCTVDDPISGDVTVTWANPTVYTDLFVYVDGVLTTTLPGTDVTTSLVLPVGGVSEICVQGDVADQVCCNVDLTPGPVINLTCTVDDAIAGDFTVAWTNGAAYTDISVFVDGVLETTLAGTATTISLNRPSGATYEICIQGDASDQVCCNASLFPPVMNDDCIDAEIVTVGTYMGNINGATNDGASTCGATAGNNDVWFSFTAPADDTYLFSTCGTHDAPGLNLGMDTVLAAFDACGGTEIFCDDDAGPPPCGAEDAGLLRDSVLTQTMLMGETILVRLSHFGGAINNGDYTFNVSNFVAPVTGVTCTLNDVLTGDATITWTNTSAYTDIFVYEAGLLVATLPSGTTSYNTTGLVLGTTTEFCIEGDTSGQVCCSVTVEAEPVANMLCDDSVADTLTGNWDLPLSIAYDSINVFVDGVFIANIGGSEITYTHALGAGFFGLAEMCVEGVVNGVSTDQVCCTGAFGGPPNDDCVDAIAIGLGTTSFDNTLATDSIEDPTCGLGGSGIWYEHTVATTGDIVVSTCGSAFDTVLSIWDVCGGTQVACNDDNFAACGAGNNSELTLAVTAGDVLLIQVGGFNGVQGAGDLTLSVACGGIEPVACTYDCATGEVIVSWTDNALAGSGYEIFENGVSIGTTAAGATSFAVAAPGVGLNTYEVTWACDLGGNGDSGTCDAEVQASVTIPGGTTDLVLHLEGLEDAGDVGGIDSGAAIEAALLAQGVSAFRAAVSDFDLLIAGNCLDITGITTIWVAAGSFPTDYSLSIGEGDFLAGFAAAGGNVYLEAGDHWGFQHIDSALDLRDGIEPDSGTNIVDGDDTFTQMDGQNAATAGLDLSASIDIGYSQDVAAGNDWTDVLSLNGTDPMLVQDDVASAEAIWLNSEDGLPDPADPDEAIAYITGVIAVHNDGGVMISQSWEFGGFALDPLDPAASDSAREDLIAAYIAAFGTVVTPTGQFRRGDCNDDGSINIADAIYGLGFLFPSGAPNVLTCREACNANDDANINIADIIALLGSLFGMPAVALPAPYPGCGMDPTGPTDCGTYNSCP